MSSTTTLIPPSSATGTARLITIRAVRGLQDWLLERPGRAVAACFIAGLALSAAASIAGGFPPPRVHDEFSYLLAGDTFAHGRLAYATHPMWKHFETFHILQVPAYASKYPPAQGLVIALGQVPTGSPIAGIWISCALMAAAFNWMLQAWTSRRWALWGAVASVLWIVGLHARDAYWATSFWGGAVAATGGALVLGGVRRLARRPTIAASLATGIGLAILANSRPFEGALFAIAPIGVVAWLVIRAVRGGQWRQAAITATPMSVVLAATVALMMFYNARITGSPTQPPYLAYEAQYGSSPNVLGQERPETPVYRNAVMEQFYTSGVGFTQPPESMKQFAVSTWKHSLSLVGFYAPWFIVPLLFVLPWAIRNAWMGLALACLTTTGIALIITLYTLQPHYAAPAAAAWTLLLVRAARYLAQFRWKRVMAGRNLVRLIFACLVASAAVQLAFSRVRLGGARESWPWRRESIERSLAVSGRHLILVEYGPGHLADKEWVYNRADIDAAPVVWARSLGAAEDDRLREYFAGRTGWRLHVDDDLGPFTLAPLEPMARNPEPETAGASR